jgi:hypothetical protein
LSRSCHRSAQHPIIELDLTTITVPVKVISREKNMKKENYEIEKQFLFVTAKTGRNVTAGTVFSKPYFWSLRGVFRLYVSTMGRSHATRE